MSRKGICTIAVAVWVSALGGYALSAQDKYNVKVPGGLAMSEFKGYEGWHAISLSRSDTAVAVILGNPVMIDAYAAGFPANGRAVPNGAKIAKIHWAPKSNAFFPATIVPGKLLNADFMEKDSKRFADSGGWGYAAFEYDGPSRTFKPATAADTPPQQNDAKCGAACHARAKATDSVFTEYGER